MWGKKIRKIPTIALCASAPVSLHFTSPFCSESCCGSPHPEWHRLPSVLFLLPLVLPVLPVQPGCFPKPPGLLWAFPLPVSSTWKSSQIDLSLRLLTPFSVDISLPAYLKFPPTFKLPSLPPLFSPLYFLPSCALYILLIVICVLICCHEEDYGCFILGCILVLKTMPGT